MKSLINYTNRRNINGKCFENDIQKKIESHFKIRTYDHKEKDRCYVKFPCLIRQVPFRTYNGTTIGRTDFGLFLNKDYCIRIECKYQNVPGSTSNKLPELYSQIQNLEEENIIVVFGGDVAKTDKKYKLFENKYRIDGITLPGYVEDFKNYETFYDDNLSGMVECLQEMSEGVL
jgi:hypothetical protein